MFYSLAFVLFSGENSGRAILCQAEPGPGVQLELMRRFGFGKYRLSATMLLSHLPPVGDPGMDAIYDLLSNDLVSPGSTANILSGLIGDAIIFGYMIANRESQRNPSPGGGDDTPDSPDDNPTGGTQ